MKTTRCEVHRLFYDEKDKGCPMCPDDVRKSQLNRLRENTGE